MYQCGFQQELRKVKYPYYPYMPDGLVSSHDYDGPYFLLEDGTWTRNNQSIYLVRLPIERLRALCDALNLAMQFIKWEDKIVD